MPNETEKHGHHICITWSSVLLLFVRNCTQVRAAQSDLPFPAAQVKESYQRGSMPCSWIGEKLGMGPALCLLLQ